MCGVIFVTFPEKNTVLTRFVYIEQIPMSQYMSYAYCVTIAMFVVRALAGL